MANETLFKVYNTGETVLVGNLAAIVPAHLHDERYYTEDEIDTQRENLEESIDELDEKLTSEIDSLEDTLINEETGLIPTLESTLRGEIDALDNEITNEETGLLKQQYDTITSETDDKLDDLDAKITGEDGLINDLDIKLTDKIDALDNEITNEETGLLKQQHDIISEETDDKLADLMSKTSNASKNRLLSHMIVVNDVLPNEHIVKCHIKSRNLFNNVDDYKPGTGAESIYSDGVLTVKNYYVVKYIKLEEGRTYTFSSVSSRDDGSNGGGIHIRAYVTENGSHYQDIISISQQLNPVATFTVPKNYPFVRFTFYANTTASTYSATYSNIMLEEGAVATEYTPYVNPVATTVHRCGANLLPYPYNGTTYPSNPGSEIRFTVNSNRSVTMSGTPTRDIQFDLVSDIELPAGTYSFAGNGTNVRVRVAKVDGTQVYYTNTFTLAEGEKVRLYAVALANQQINYTFFPMLNAGSSVLPYEPYVGEDYVADENGVVDGMKSVAPNMTIYTNTTNTLIDCEYNRDINDVISFYDDTLNVFKGKSATITLATTSWVGSVSPFYQNINIPFATANSKIDLQPTVQQIVDLQDEEVTLVVENDNGNLKVWAIGYKPLKDYEIQATITEVVEQ